MTMAAYMGDQRVRKLMSWNCTVATHKSAQSLSVGTTVFIDPYLTVEAHHLGMSCHVSDIVLMVNK